MPCPLFNSHKQTYGIKIITLKKILYLKIETQRGKMTCLTLHSCDFNLVFIWVSKTQSYCIRLIYGSSSFGEKVKATKTYFLNLCAYEFFTIIPKNRPLPLNVSLFGYHFLLHRFFFPLQFLSGKIFTFPR